uniref:Sigma-70, region 4 n=1 Tax=Candidatus Kentrum sp. LFY TaxID=2126342 RepID=A0A450U8G2_9GAMM|nr:MAG: Sigma-70, region 4 [Candidatus Kentron sp. LFY]
MPNKRIPMRKIKEVLRLHFESGLGHRKIAQVLNISKGAVGNYLGLAKAKGISWPLPEGMDLVIITVYEPDSLRWMKGFSRRRT